MRIEHIAVWSHDIERLRDFYERYFGATAGPMYENPGNRFRSYFLSFSDGARLELMQMPEIPATLDDPLRQFTGFIHIAVSVGTETAVDGLTERLRADGHRVLDGPRRTGDGYYESTVQDPDG